MRKVHYTAVLKKRPKGYIGWVEEVPGANTQGKSKSEVMENLKEALVLILESNRAATSRTRSLSRYPFELSIPA